MTTHTRDKVHNTFPGRGSEQFPLRLPDGFRDEIKAAAKANGRSMNAEIVARLASGSQLDRIEAKLDALLSSRLALGDYADRVLTQPL